MNKKFLMIVSIVVAIFLISSATATKIEANDDNKNDTQKYDNNSESDEDKKESKFANLNSFLKKTFGRFIDFFKNFRVFSFLRTDFDTQNNDFKKEDNDKNGVYSSGIVEQSNSGSNAEPLGNSGLKPIEITKTDNFRETEWALKGKKIYYNITVKNPDSNDPISQVNVIDSLPSQVEFLYGESTEWYYDSEDHYAYKVYENMDPGETHFLNLTVRVKESINVPCMINNTVKANSSLLSFNSTFERTAIGPGIFTELDILKEDNTPDGWVKESTLSDLSYINYSITVCNQNLLDVHNVTIRDKLDDVVNFVGCSHEGNDEDINGDTVVFWGFDVLETGESKTLWLNVSVDPSVSPGSQILNKVYIICNETDPDEGYAEELTWIVERNAPISTIYAGEPQYELNNDLFVTRNTPITIESEDDQIDWTGVENLTYKIYKNGVFKKSVLVEDNKAGDVDNREGFIKTVFTFDEQCKHTVRFFACDMFNQETTNEDNEEEFFVYDNEPHLDYNIGSPKESCFYEYGDECYMGISDETPIEIFSLGTDGCAGGVPLDHLGIEVYRGENYGEWESLYTMHVEDGDPEDLTDPDDGMIKVRLTMDESCWHQIHYWVEDKLGNRNPALDSISSINVIVDAEGPDSIHSYEGPQYIDSYRWITNETEKIIYSFDEGCIPGGSGVDYIDWSVEKKIEDFWTVTKKNKVYDNDVKDIDGTPASPKHGDLGGLVAFDHKGEPYLFKDTNNNWTYDNNENHTDVIISLDQDQDGPHSSFLASPTDGEPGGLWVMDHKNEPYLLIDENNNWRYDSGEEVINYDPDEDYYDGWNYHPKHLAEPSDGDKAGLYAFDSNNEPFTFQDLTIYNYSEDTPEWVKDVDDISEAIDFILNLTQKPDWWPEQYDWLWKIIDFAINYLFGKYITAFEITNLIFDFIVDNYPSIIEKSMETTPWQFDSYWSDHHNKSISEPITCLKPDYDGEGTVKVKFNITSDGEYNIYHQAFDRLKNPSQIKKQYVRVDNTPPESYIDVFEPKCEDLSLDYGIDYCVTTDTVIDICTEDKETFCAVGVDYLEYTLFKDGVFYKHVKKHDFDHVEIDFQSEGKYVLYYRSVDFLGNTEDWNNVSFIVDDQAPIIYKNVSGPKLPGDSSDPSEPDFWITTDTEITIEGSNTGCPHWWLKYWINDNGPESKPGIKFDYECKYTLEIWAYDCLGNSVTDIERFYVDDTAPEFHIIKPHNGIYSKGDTFHVTYHTEDEPAYAPPCYDDHAVGIEDGSIGEAWIVDVNPELEICELIVDDFIYNNVNHEFDGVVTIPNDCSIPDGSAYFVGGASDDLGNGVNNVKNMIKEYYNTYGVGSTQLQNLLNQLLDENKIVEIVIDNEDSDDVTPPDVCIYQPDEGESVESNELYLNVGITDDTGITEGTPCTVTLDGIDLGNGLYYDSSIDGAEGTLSIPNSVSGGIDLPLVVSVEDTAGNLGSQTIYLDYEKDMEAPVVNIVNPVDGETYEQDMLTIQIEASDDKTDEDDLDVRVTIDVESYHEYFKTATYDSCTGFYVVDFDISKLKNDAQIQIQAYATDSDGKTGSTSPVECFVSNDIYFAEYLPTGWSPIEIGIIKGDSGVESVFDSIWDDFEIIFELETGKNYIAGEGGNTLSEITTTNTYWVKMKNSEEFYLED